jgi:enamine deaminase RidA (YjgF/YER057c/UK114 family)
MPNDTIIFIEEELKKMLTSAELFKQVAALGLELPPVLVANGGYDLVRVSRGLGHVSGQLPRTGTRPDELIKGRLRNQDDIPRGQQAARLCLVRALLALHQHLGDLLAVEGLVSIRGFLNTEPEFEHHAKVMDAASNLARDLFGEAGRHARSALGVASLPSGGLVELELVVEISRTVPNDIRLTSNTQDVASNWRMQR